MTEQTLYIVAAVLVGVIGSARVVRLIAQDAFPPAQWLRDTWPRLVRGSEKWSPLVECPWCIAPYVVAPNLAWFHYSDGHWSWWVLNGWLAASYAASWLVFHDED